MVARKARPLTDLGHVGSIVFGILLALVAIWSLWRARVRPCWFIPTRAAIWVFRDPRPLASPRSHRTSLAAPYHP